MRQATSLPHFSRVRLSQNFPDNKIFHGKIFRKERMKNGFLFGQLCKAHLWIIWTSSRSSRQFLDHLDIQQTIQTPFRSFGYYGYHPDTFQIIHTLSLSYGYFSDDLGTEIYIIWLLLRPSGFRIFTNVPVSFAGRLTSFFLLCISVLPKLQLLCYSQCLGPW